MRTSVEKFPSLADFLGVQDAEQPDLSVASAPSPKVTVKDFSKGILQSPQYRDSILRRIVMDMLPSAVECMLWDRAYGKAIHRVELDDKSAHLENLTPELVRQKLERTKRLLQLLDAAQAGTFHTVVANEDEGPESVH